MFVEDTANLLRRYIDEADTTFFPDSEVSNLLRIGYDEFRQAIIAIDPFAYGTAVNIPMANLREYNFAAPANPVRLMGNPVGGLTGPRLQRILFLGVNNTNGSLRYQFFPVKTHEELVAQGGRGRNVYLFAGTNLFFWFSVTDTVSLLYLPYPSMPDNATGIDWTQLTVGSNQFIDDYNEFHDLISAFSARLYMIYDGGSNQQIESMIHYRLESLHQRMAQGRDVNMSIAMSYRPAGG